MTMALKGSKLERKWVLCWRKAQERLDHLPVPDLVAEHRFAKGTPEARQWRFDFAHLETRVAIEIEGGIHARGTKTGRHTRGAGFEEDCRKYLAAALEGWTVLRLTGRMCTVPTAERIARWIMTRQELASVARLGFHDALFVTGIIQTLDNPGGCPFRTRVASQVRSGALLCGYQRTQEGVLVLEKGRV